MKSIEIVIAPTGELRIEAMSFKGADCEKATRFLEEALGRITGKQHKPEFHQKARQQQRVGGGP